MATSPPLANTWITSPVSWALVFLGWWMSPAVSFYLNKFFTYLDLDASRKLRGLEIDTIPKLKQTLSDAEEQRMTRQDEDNRSESDLIILDRITKDLKSALHEAEDILDLVDYRLTEKRLTGHGPAGACISRCIASWEKNLRGAADAHISCWKTSCSDQWRNIVIRVKLLRDVVGGWISRCKSCFRSRAGNRSSADAVSTPAVSVQEVSMTIDAESVSSADAIFSSEEGSRTIFSAEAASIPAAAAESVSISSADAISNAGDLSSAGPVCMAGDISIATSSVESNSTVYKLRAWCNEAFGVRDNQEDAIIDSFLHTVSRIWLMKRIQQIEYILNDSIESHPLNRQNKNDSEIPINHTDKERRSTQEQIDELYRKIELKVFGRDKELERICAKFREISAAYGTESCSSSKPYSVLGIHGIAGSGKSTLANYICDNEKMAKDKHFDLVMFTHVSVTFRLEKIFCDMLRQNSKDGQSHSMNIESLLNEVTEKLKGKRFLLVLDDLWVNDKNQTERDILLAALRAGKNGSIILVTAQREDAAAAIGAQDQDQIPIPDLEEEKYLSLFMQLCNNWLCTSTDVEAGFIPLSKNHALQRATDDDGEYERIGRKIAGKLHRSPIAAVTVARRLQTNINTSDWETAASLNVLNKTMGALWWSYQQLGADIRRCFAYLSTFPRGYVLRRDGLVRMWIAQGFVNTTSNAAEELEDVGLRYFEELLKFSFLQVINDLTISSPLDRNNFTLPSLQELDEDKAPEAFVIHDLLHELAERVAGSDFLRIDDLSVLPAKDILSGVRHLFIETRKGAQVAQIVEREIELGNLRTLIIMEPFEFMERTLEMEKILESLFRRQRKLRVIIMHLGHCPDVLSFPASIYQMKHLRYLGFHVRTAFLSDGSVMKLKFPSTFSKLYHMQTVFIGLSVSYPESMDNLIHLRHTYASTDLPNVGKLTSLQTMEYFHVDKKEQGYKLKQLKNLNNLRGYLKIVGLANVVSKEEALEAQLTSKKRLTSLSLGFCGGTKASGIKAEVLEGLCPPKHLQKLTIEDYDTSKYPSWMLSGQHPDAPKHLHSLQLNYCSLLESIPEDSELFRHLRELNIHNCNGSSLPENMERLVSLQSLSISGSGDKMKLPPTLPRSLNKIRIKGFDWDSLPEHVKWPISLQSLDICYCNKIALLPPLPLSLNKIIVYHCHVLSRTCKEEGHENWHKIQHIPCKEIAG